MRPFSCVPIGPIARAVFLCPVVILSGCGPWGPAEFRLNTEGHDPSEINLSQREAINSTLAELFGTPERPLVPPGVPLDLALLQAAAGPVRSDRQGKQWGLYRLHCAACHGISGDGAGAIAAVLAPYPRDFRDGVYKYTSTKGGARPVREDLRRVIQRGNPGTAMPSFERLTEEEIDALVQYVMYLSIRGETELYVFQLVVDEDKYPVDMKRDIEDGLLLTVDLWTDAQNMMIAQEQAEQQAPPTDTHDQLVRSIDRGHELYSSKNARCVECHGPRGEGDGQQSELYDHWNKPKKGATPQQTRERARLYRLSIQRVRPRNFAQQAFRGGDDPIDVYRRIHVGIKGTPMPAGGPAPGSTGSLTEEQIWDVVNYVLARTRGEAVGGGR